MLTITEDHQAASPPILRANPDDLQRVLAAWAEATDRLQRTHETLRTEVRRLTDELEAKNRELARRNRLADLGQMAAHIAHEVRNGLVPLKLYTGLLRRRVAADTESLAIVGKISTGLTGLEATVNDLLHFSAEREPAPEHVPLAPFLLEICDSLAPQLQAHDIEVTLDAPRGSAAWADREMLRRALLNLVLNAVDAMPRGGRLCLTTVRCGEWVELEVADSGPGIPEAALAHLFEPFFTTKSQGTGLGLAIVDCIAEAHGGGITAANCPEGGAAFTLRLPAIPTHQPEKSP